RYGIVLPRFDRPSYVIIVDRAKHPDADAALMESYRYREARHLGQLARAEVRVVPDAEERVLDYFAGTGMKPGDIKPIALVLNRAEALALERALQEPHAQAV